MAGDAYAGSMQAWERSHGDLLHRLLYTDINSYLIELLMKQDQMSMAASIESRVPFLDHVLVEFTARIPAQYSIHGMAGKFILKQAVEDLLPKSIIYRKKMGFPTPWAYWLAGPQLGDLERMLLEPRTAGAGSVSGGDAETNLRRASQQISRSRKQDLAADQSGSVATRCHRWRARRSRRRPTHIRGCAASLNPHVVFLMIGHQTAAQR